MATPLSPDITILGLSFKDFITIIVPVCGVAIYFFKQYFDDKHQRFLKGEKLTADELDLMRSPRRQEVEWATKSQEERKRLRQNYTLHEEVAVIENEKWSGFYLHSLERLIKSLPKLLGETNTELQGNDSSLFNLRLFTMSSYEFCLRLAFIYPLLLIVFISSLVYFGSQQLFLVTGALWQWADWLLQSIDPGYQTLMH